MRDEPERTKPQDEQDQGEGRIDKDPVGKIRAGMVANQAIRR